MKEPGHAEVHELRLPMSMGTAFAVQVLQDSDKKNKRNHATAADAETASSAGATQPRNLTAAHFLKKKADGGYASAAAESPSAGSGSSEDEE